MPRVYSALLQVKKTTQHVVLKGANDECQKEPVTSRRVGGCIAHHSRPGIVALRESQQPVRYQRPQAGRRSSVQRQVMVVSDLLASGDLQGPTGLELLRCTAEVCQPYPGRLH